MWEGFMGPAILIFENITILLIVFGIALVVGVWAIIQGEIESGQLAERFRESRLFKWRQKLFAGRENNSENDE